MKSFTLAGPADFDGWRLAARQALQAGFEPGKVSFDFGDGAADLFAETWRGTILPRPGNGEIAVPHVPKPFLDLARQVACHSDRQRFAKLYSLVWRMQLEPHVLKKLTDADVAAVNAMAKEVRRDVHKMKAFVRFRLVETDADGNERFVAWFEPTHNIVEYAAPFFVRRFHSMRWLILTPKACAHWDGKTLGFTEGAPRSAAPADDDLETYWRSYYASIFNPARLKISAMTSEMPKKYWKNLPEASLIPDLIRQAQSRETQMRTAGPTSPLPSMMKHIDPGPSVPDLAINAVRSLDDLKTCLSACRNCPLWNPATQAVPGEGLADAAIMLVGEQPGDHEDVTGRPFVGPAGQLLRSTMEEAGIEDAYLTNAVKHFKFEPRGKRRLHKTPNAPEIEHCRWWLHKEIELVRPKVIVALGKTALRSITGETGTIAEMRGTVRSLSDNRQLIVTRHPSSVLRAQDIHAKDAARSELLDDLSLARRTLAALETAVV